MDLITARLSFRAIYWARVSLTRSRIWNESQSPSRLYCRRLHPKAKLHLLEDESQDASTRRDSLRLLTRRSSRLSWDRKSFLGPGSLGFPSEFSGSGGRDWRFVALAYVKIVAQRISKAEEGGSIIPLSVPHSVFPRRRGTLPLTLGCVRVNHWRHVASG